MNGRIMGQRVVGQIVEVTMFIADNGQEAANYQPDHDSGPVIDVTPRQRQTPQRGSIRKGDTVLYRGPNGAKTYNVGWIGDKNGITRLGLRFKPYGKIDFFVDAARCRPV